MVLERNQIVPDRVSVTPSARTRHAELLLLCARIGYSPHRPA
ncbi:hypothetical protein [Aquamicrobium sp.]